MKKISLLMMATGLLAFAACEKEADVKDAAPKSQETVTIQATLEGNPSKMIVADADGKVSWKAQDYIKIWDSGKDDWETSEKLTEGGDKALFTFTGLSSDSNRSFYAVYPAYDDFKKDGDGLKTTFPKQILWKPGNNPEDAPVKMIAKNTPGKGLEFKHIGSLLRITIKDVPKGTQYLRLLFEHDVMGEYEVKGLDTEPFAPYVESKGEMSANSIFVYPTSALTEMQDMVVNVPVPTGEYNTVKVIAVDVNNNPIPCNIVATIGKTLNRREAAKVEVYMPVFSVSPTKKVVFSPGNLQASTEDYGENWTWKFADQQYGLISGAATVDGKMHISTESGSRDYFRWSTAQAADYGINAETTGATYYEYVDDTFVDWGTNVIEWGNYTYPENTWRTLGANLTYYFAVFPEDIESKAGRGEWEYLFEERSASTLEGRVSHNGTETETVENARFVMGKIDGVRVYILFPDHFTYPEDLVKAPYLNKHSSWWRAEYTAVEWKIMEEAGAVAIPVDSSGSTFYYTSTKNAGDDTGWGANFLYLSYLPSGYTTCSRIGWGRPWQNYHVRLVRDAN